MIMTRSGMASQSVLAFASGIVPEPGSVKTSARNAKLLADAKCWLFNWLDSGQKVKENAKQANYTG